MRMQARLLLSQLIFSLLKNPMTWEVVSVVVGVWMRR